jgi:uncharacterized protein (DUF1684 family)
MVSDPLMELADYRRRVAQMYAAVRQSTGEPEQAWQSYRVQREKLFRTHSQSPLDRDQKEGFSGLSYFPYKPSCAYNPRWHCPLAPRENWVSVALRAGELRYHDGTITTVLDIHLSLRYNCVRLVGACSAVGSALQSH